MVARTRAWGLFLLGTMALCSQGYGEEEAVSDAGPASARPGVVFVVGGIGMVDFVGPAAQWKFPRAGVPHEIRHFVWNHGFCRFFKDLQDIRFLMQKAEELAEEVRQVKEEDPDRPVYLIGKSAGAELVLATAERLPPGSLERVILLSAAVAPDHDLRPALRATRKELISYYSRHDRLILSWGTSQFGTADRFYGPSAGCVGFLIPSPLSAEDQGLYNRLVQVPWNPGMILEGHLGTHLGTSMPGFLSAELTPWLLP
jgi:hypothetical protein